MVIFKRKNALQIKNQHGVIVSAQQKRWMDGFRARCDYGMENVLVAQFMLERRGLDRGSIITGSSVRNCRVERAHRDVYAGVLCFYAKLFDKMDKTDILDPFNELHLCCLHYIYFPRINKSLEEFVNQMNHRPVSTEHNVSSSAVDEWHAAKQILNTLHFL